MVNVRQGLKSMISRVFHFSSSLRYPQNDLAYYAIQYYKTFGPKIRRFALKLAKLTLQKIAKSLNGHKTSTE